MLAPDSGPPDLEAAAAEAETFALAAIFKSPAHFVELVSGSILLIRGGPSREDAAMGILIALVATTVAVASQTQLAQLTSRISPPACIDFVAPRIVRGASFRAPLMLGLWLQIQPRDPEGAFGWSITVTAGPDGEKDFVWPVSPPYRTAPQLVIGRGYGDDSTQSARFSPRELRFVLTLASYTAAADIAGGPWTPERLESLGRIPTGELMVGITNFEAGPDDALSWIALEGRACAPS